MNYLIFAGSMLLSFLATVFLERKFIPFLMRIKMGQTILEIGPRWHKSKEGTPTMGGIFFMGGILISFLVFGTAVCTRTADLTPVKILLMMFLFGAIGFLDDFVKFVKKRNKGLSAIQKLIFQFAVASAFLFSMKDSLSTSLALPFTSLRLELGVFYWVFSIFFIVYMVNSVNLTDGIDGLCAGTSFVVFLFFAVLGFISGNESQIVLYAAVCGGMLGFLIYNFYPARIFMGDTGSLFLGGALTGAAYWLNQPLIIVICGFVFLFEALSVVLQVVSFKLTKKRIFKMAPFHHHLEMCGWKEPGIVCFAVLLSTVFSLISYFAF